MIRPNQITAANAGWRTQFRFAVRGLAPGVVEFYRSASLHFMRIARCIAGGIMMAIIVIGCSRTTSKTDNATKTSQKTIYDESANGDKQVADAVVTAKKEHKCILLQFGANWCVWCRRLDELFRSDNLVNEVLRADYVVALIDVNDGRNRDLVVKYGAETGYGLPFLVVLDGDGRHLITKHSDDFEEGDHHNPQKVLAFLKAPLTTNAPTLRGAVENSGAIRDEVSSRQIAMALLEMHHEWFTNGYRSKGMKLPRFLAEQGQVRSSSAGILGAYVEYDFQENAIEWTRSFRISRADTNTTNWVLSEYATPNDTNLVSMAREQKLITVTGEP